MNVKLILPAVISLALFFGCSSNSNVVTLKNDKQGTLIPTVKLAIAGEKKFPLDSISAPKIPYMQVFSGDSNTTCLSFLNTYASAIYIYDYATAVVKKVIKFSRDDKDGVNNPLGYYLKNKDSIYIYNKKNNQLVLLNDSSRVLSRISLINEQPFHELSWTFFYPQYYPSTAAPLMGIGNQIVFPGQYMFSLPDTIARRFKFESHIDCSNNKVTFSRQYPDELYGHNYFWENEGLFTNVYSDIAPDHKMVYSFPVSHQVYLANTGKEGYTPVYGGSNEAGTITSFNKKLSGEELVLKVCQTDLYAAIKYDPYRKVYYRLLRKAIPDATPTSTIKDKPLSVIVFDENFKYMGETTIGTCNDFNWENAFVTAEGLNIEYLDKNDRSEAYLYLKIFKPVNLK
ncbi:uncharacterized protein DUF4221 [Chitinophaga polysaccharea]|uniref:Uncharacterized protein DUF4221 n=1 Tax=Chitinophaga polysaccharea TaxID=1293035 RepID=A0A561P3V8_9BACT|nr:DUF4221 family protein [Chitinophaga polysaccharea]TWF32796.1 uncharacterized protein DUF4221 [Chitinophaga polysaccharea]